MNEKAPLYLHIIMRTDLDSMNPGKMAAQATHAANSLVHYNANHDMINEWQSQTNQGFGNVLIRAGGSMDIIQNVMDEVKVKSFNAFSEPNIIGVVNDPTYPVRDGGVTHYVDIRTCAYVLCRGDSKIHKLLSERFPLYP